MKNHKPLARHGAISTLLAIASLFLTGMACADVVSDNAATWLRNQQFSVAPNAGAFPWQPGGPATKNTQGASALGLLRSWERGGNVADLAAAVANGDCQINNCIAGMTYPDTDHRFATHDPLFLEQLSIDSGDPQYANFVEDEFWDRLRSTSYGEFNNLDAAGYANAVLGSRTGQEYADLAAWDLSKTAIAAQLAGEFTARDAMMDGILASLNASDSANTTFDVVGLTGAVWASAVTGVDLDPTSGKWAAASNTADLAAMLLGYQAPSGGFVGSTTAVGGASDANADTQTTAFAMQALDAVDAVVYETQIQAGFSYITSLQVPATGEFLSYIGAAPGVAGSVENQGEVLEAYASITQRPLNVYVDDGYVGTMPGAVESFSHPQLNGGAAFNVVYGQDAFATIAEALTQVQIGGNVYVAKGVYAENFLTITRPVSIIGEQATVDARSRAVADADETIIVPGIAQSGLTLSSYGVAVIDIASDAVSIDGVIVDADNPALNSMVPFNGTNPDVSVGLYVQGNDFHALNSIFRNIIYAGINGYEDPSTSSGGNLIHHNRFANITAPSLWGIGVILQFNFYAQVTDNLFDEVRVGVQTNTNYRAAPNGFLPSISGNEIHAARIGIFHNQFFSSASTYAISGNQMIAAANAGETGQWMGLWVETMQDAQTVTINDNIIDGQAVVSSRPSVGYLLNYIVSSASSSSVIAGGSVSHVGAGVLATDATRYTGAVNDFVVRNVAFSDIGIAAFYVEDTVEQVGTAKLSIGDGNGYTSVAHVLALSGSAPAVSFVDSQSAVPSVFVRSARGYFYNPMAATYTVVNASINPAIGYAQMGGTVSVEDGSFNQNVNVNKSVILEGAFAGTTGFDPTRTGSGETVITPASGSAFSLAASNAVVDGFTVTIASGVAVGPAGASRDDIQFINNRVVDIVNGVGIQFEPGEGTPASGLQISGNLFSNVNGSGVNGAAIQLYKGTRNAIIHNNHIDSARTYAIQVNGGNGSVLNTAITGNVISDSLALGTYNAFVTTNVDGMQIRDNTITGVSTGVFFSDKVSNLDVLCNSIDAINRGISTSDFFGNVPNTAIRIFDNEVLGGAIADVNNGQSQALVVGSNWYGGTPAQVTGSNVLVADALPATPIGQPACGVNAPTSIVAYAGTSQNTQVSTAFGSSLDARVVDALGGAVMGESVSFAAPGSGASASLGTTSGTSNYNGVVSTTAMANILAGSYAVTASSGSLTPDASFALTNDPIIGTVTWGPLSFVFDGNTHVVTAHITEELATSCVVTPAIGPNVGSITVTATCNGSTYAASGTATASITPASATLALSNLTQTYDGSPKPATVIPTPSGVLYSVTYNGSNTAPSAIGDYAVVATIVDPNYSGPQASNVLHIVEADAPDLGISITDNRDFVQYGKLLTYTIVVNNPGNTNMTGATVTSSLPITLLNANPSWQCVQVSPGASCTASGTGNLSDPAVTIPAGGGVVYLFNAWVDDNASLPTDVISTTATVSATGDTNNANDSATDVTQAVIFRDGFDGGDGAEDVNAATRPNQTSALKAENMQMLDLALAWSNDGRISELARIDGDNGNVIQIQTLRTSEHLLVRMLGSNEVSAWTTIDEGVSLLAIGLADQSLLLMGGAEELRFAINSTTAQIWTSLPGQ